VPADEETVEHPLALAMGLAEPSLVWLRQELEGRGGRLQAAQDPSEALDVLATRPVRLLIAPASRSDEDWLLRASSAHPSLVILLLDDHAGEGRRSQPSRGVFDVIPWPSNPSRLAPALERALRHGALLHELEGLRDEAQDRFRLPRLVGRSVAMERLRERLRGLAGSNASVLFLGEAGSGKELAARSLHAISNRSEGPWVRIEASGLAAAPPGKPEARASEAAGGTLLVDGLESADRVDRDRLARLLKGLPTGSRAPRLLASSRIDLRLAAEEGRFGADLRDMLSEATVRVPPLRERGEDVALLTRHFVEVVRKLNDLPPVTLLPESMETLLRYGWPGNVRELRNAIEHAIVVCSDGTIRPGDLPGRILGAGALSRFGPEPPRLSDRTFRDAKRDVVDAFERAYLEDLLERHDGNVTTAAQHSGMLRSALQRLLRKHRLRSAAFRSVGGRLRPEDAL
jgi:DNA-binding NtrC family response regulator